MDENIHLSENIACLRKAKNETQIQLAEAIGVSNKTISKWEAGDSEPELKYIYALAQHFETSMDILITGVTEKSKALYSASYREAALKYFRDGVEKTFIFMNSTDYSAEKKPHKPLITGNHLSWNGSEGNYTGAQTSEIFVRAHSSNENNMLITLMQNEDNFGWIDRNSDRMSEIFSILAEPGVLPLVKFVHTDGTPVWISAEYAAEKTGCRVENARALFELMTQQKEVIEFEDGKRTVYCVCGNGCLLSAISLIYEAFLDQKSDGTQTLSAVYKPIFNEEKE